jgi:hypothetical protein
LRCATSTAGCIYRENRASMTSGPPTGGTIRGRLVTGHGAECRITRDASRNARLLETPRRYM